jgi:NTE family protein
MAFSLVLSGGGLKGLAHIGVLRALEERGLQPSLVIGVSMGALIAAAWASGRRVRELEDRALSLERSDVFRIAHLDMALRRMMAPAVYRREPLERIIKDLVGDRTFKTLDRRLLVNTVDINSGHQMLWGLPGLDDAPVADAVFASCALPGILPPREVNGHFCADGAIVDNLPVRAAAAVGEGPVVAIDVGAGGVERAESIARLRHDLRTRHRDRHGQARRAHAARLDHSTLVLIRPKVTRVGMFAFNRTRTCSPRDIGRPTRRWTCSRTDSTACRPAAFIRCGTWKCASIEALRGCGLCAAMNPRVFAMDDTGKATVRVWEWTTTPSGDVAVRICPTCAISAEPVPPQAL